MKVRNKKKELSIKFQAHLEPISQVRIFPNGDRLASSSKDMSVKVWNLVEKVVLLKTLKGHSDWVSCIDVISNEILVSGSYDKTIRVWDTIEGKCMSVLRGHTEEVYSVVGIGNSILVASGSRDCSIRIWSLEKYKCVHVLRGHSDSVNCLGFLRQNTLVSASLDKTLKFWNILDGKCLRSIEMDHTNDVRSLCVINKLKIATGSRDCKIKIWNLQKTGNKLEKTIISHIHDVLCIKVWKDWLITSSKDKTIRIFDPYTGTLLKAWKAHRGFIRSIDIRKKDGAIISAGDDLKIRIWNIKYPKVSPELRKTIVIKKQEDVIQSIKRELFFRNEENKRLKKELKIQMELMNMKEKKIAKLESTKMMVFPLAISIPVTAVGLIFIYYFNKGRRRKE